MDDREKRLMREAIGGIGDTARAERDRARKLYHVTVMVPGFPGGTRERVKVRGDNADDAERNAERLYGDGARAVRMETMRIVEFPCVSGR